MKSSNTQSYNFSMGKTFTVKNITGNTSIKKRLISLGIIKDCKITIYKQSPFGDPIIIIVNNSKIALRKELFKNIII